MSYDAPTNRDDVIDSRAVIERIEELEAEREALADTLTEAQEQVTAENDSASIAKAYEAADEAGQALREWDQANGEELKALQALAEQAEGYASDWQHGEPLIRDSYFKTYARELAEDLYGNELRDSTWPFNCIDWEQAALELAQDYMAVDFDGVEYLMRA